MAIDDFRTSGGGNITPMPMQIAHNPLLTAREKLDLLTRLKA